jgi:hypothetical protein
MARSVHIVVRLLAGLIALLVIALALLAARLSAGPLSLAPASPLIEWGLSAISPYRFQIGDADLLWRDWRRGLRVHFADVQISGENNAAHGQIENVAVAVSAEALAQGVLAPSSIEVNRAVLTLSRNLDGFWLPSPRGGDNAHGSLANLLAGLRSTPDPRRPLSYLFDVRIDNLTVRLQDDPAEADWRLRIDTARFARDETAALSGNASVLLSRGDEDAVIGIDLGTTGPDSVLDGEIVFSGLRPAAFAALVPDLAALTALDLPLQGKVALDLAPDGTPGDVEIAVSSDGGALVVTEQLTALAGLATPEQRLPLRRLALQASLTPELSRVAVRSLDLVFQPRTTVYVPAPIDHRFPLSLISGTGSFVDGRLSLPTLDLDLGGLRLSVKADVDKMLEAARGTASLVAINVKVDDFRRYWPPKLVPGAYIWCTQHLRDGIVPRVRARVAFTTRDGKTDVTSADADFDVERLTVDHLPPMPPVRNARGHAKIDLKTMTIDITGGQSAGLTVSSGRVFFPDLDRDVPSIDIDLLVAGPVRSAMKMIASEPLRYPQKIGISPEQTSGEMTARLRLGFPLLAALKIEEMDIRAVVDLKDAAIADLAKGVNITNAQARLDIDTAGMHAKGTLDIADVNGDLDLTYSFADGVDPQARMEFVAQDVELTDLRRRFPELGAVDGYLLDGSMDARVRATVAENGRASIDGTLDLAGAAVSIPYLGWRKDVGSPAKVDAALQTEGERLAAVPRLSFTAPGMDVLASLRLGSDGGLERLNIERLLSGRNDASATIARLTDGQWDITVSGNSVDLQPLFEAEGDSARESGPSFGSWPELTFAADLDAVWVGGPAPIGDVIATLVHDGGLWTLAQAQGRLSDGSMIDFSVTPADGQGRILRVSAGNAGEALRAFQVFPDMIGGRMETEGRFDDSDPAHPLRAKLRVKNYHIVNTPILARLLGLLSLGGIRDALTGKGIHFSTLEMPFQASKGVVAIDNGKAFGSALGLTVSGSIDTKAESLDIQGQLVPFYAVNSAIGHVPLIGDIMIGGDEGGGIFSASYSVIGVLQDPDVSVNPVTVLFPGFLRWILETFECWVSPDVTGESGTSETMQ